MARKKSTIVQSSAAQELAAAPDSLTSATPLELPLPAIQEATALNLATRSSTTANMHLAIITDATGSTPLTAEERERLAECESEIGANLKSVFVLAKAIRQVRDGRLYREHYGNFEEYCESRWDMKRSYAYNLIDACQRLRSLGWPIRNTASQ